MKNTRYFKIAAIALSCMILIAGIIGISVSANGADASAEFVNVTLNYGAETRIAYALSIDGADASDVTLELYDNAELSGEPVKATFSGSYYDSIYPVYYSYGIAAKDLADYIYARPVLKNGDVIGETVRYSVAQYCYSVLSNPANDETLLTLAEDLLSYGASAQARLIKIGNIANETLVTEYAYAYAGVEGVSFGGYGSTLVAPGVKVVPTYAGATPTEWIVTVNGVTTTVSAADAALGIEVSGIAKFEPSFTVPEGFENENSEVYLDATNAVYYETTSGIATPSIVADPTDADNKVLVMGGNGSTSQERAFANLSETEEGANHFTFVTKLYFEKPLNSTKELIRFNFLGVTGINRITLNTVYNDNAFKAHIKDAGSFVTDADGNKVVLDFETWYDFKIEYTVLNSVTGAGKITISLAKCGEALATVYEANVTVTSGSKIPTQIRLQREKDQATTAIYFDDMLFFGEAE